MVLKSWLWAQEGILFASCQGSARVGMGVPAYGALAFAVCVGWGAELPKICKRTPKIECTGTPAALHLMHELWLISCRCSISLIANPFLLSSVALPEHSTAKIFMSELTEYKATLEDDVSCELVMNAWKKNYAPLSFGPPPFCLRFVTSIRKDVQKGFQYDINNRFVIWHQTITIHCQMKLPAECVWAFSYYSRWIFASFFYKFWCFVFTG